MLRICRLHRDLVLSLTQEGEQLSQPRPTHSLAWDYRSHKIRICRKILRDGNTARWVPPALTRLALRLAEREIIESILAWDPDVIVAPGVTWLPYLQTLLHKNGIPVPCTTAEEPPETAERFWRQYDASPRVSIVLPTYNGVKYLGQSIESCLTQTHQNVELVIVDDGSREDVRAVVDQYRDARLIYVRHERNRGLSEALNTGFRRATGDYLTWTSDDNFYDPRAVETMLRFLQTYPQIDFVYADYYIKDERTPGQSWAIQRTQPPDWLKTNNGIGACYLYKRAVYTAVGDFNSSAFLAEDYDYWVRVWKRFRMQRLFVPLYYYRYHQASLTGQYGSTPVQDKVRLVKRLNKIKA